MLDLKKDITVIRQENQKICERTTDLENRVSTMEDALPFIKRGLQQTKVQIKDQAQRLDNLKNRQRHNNFCILGFPEHEEGQSFFFFLKNG